MGTVLGMAMGMVRAGVLGLAIMISLGARAAATTFDVTVPLKEGKFHLGDITLRIVREAALTDKTPFAVEKAQFTALVAPLLKGEVIETLTTAPEADRFVDVGELRRRGFALSFAVDDMMLTFAPVIEQRKRGSIRIAYAADTVDPQTLAAPARIAGYVNLSGGVNQTGSFQDGRGLAAQALAMDGSLRILDTVIENEATLVNGRLQRNGTRFVFDQPQDAIRMIAGDITARGAGLQSSQSLLGVSVEKTFGQLQPQKNIRPLGARSFRLERPSDVEVIVNGHVARRFQLNAGDYDLSDIALRAGENTVKLAITDDAGRTETLDFTILFDRALLADGIAEWGMAAGARSLSTGNGPLYDFASPLATGYYRVGLNETLTGAVQARLTPSGAAGGVSLITQTPLGFWAVNTGVSYGADGGGGAVDVHYAPGRILDRFGVDGTLRLNAGFASQGYTDAWASLTENNAHATVSYGQPLADDLLLNLTGGFTQGGVRGSWQAAAGLSKAVQPGVTWGLNTAYDTAPRDGGYSVMANLTIRTGPSSDLAITQDGISKRTTASMRADTTQNGETFAAKLDLDKDPPWQGRPRQNGFDGSFSYSGPRFELATQARHTFWSRGVPAPDSYTLRGATALAFADGQVAFGRPIGDSFAILTPHPSLDHGTIRVGDLNGQNGLRADGLGPVLVSDLSSYAKTQIPVDVDGAPDGYDLGAGEFAVQPRRHTGYALTVGSDAAVSASGTLNTADGLPIVQVAGRAVKDGEKPNTAIELFTNASGRYIATGLKPGTWRIEIETDPVTCFRLVIPEGVKGQFDSGVVRPSCS